MQADILVTGANGFVGRALCAQLTRAGLPVRGAVRSDAARSGLACQHVVIGDIGPGTDWTAALRGVAVIVHLAARVHIMDDRTANPLDAYRHVNVAGTEALARQAVAAKVRRIVFLSSIKVNGETRDLPGFNEADPPRPEDAYGISKLEAEQRLVATCARTDTEYVILRSPLIYGPSVKGNLAALIRLIDRGIPLPLASIDNRRSIICLDNLIAAIRLAVEHPAAIGKTFLVSDDRPVSSPELARAIAAALGRPPRLLPIPMPLLLLAGLLTGRGPVVKRLTSSLIVDSRAIREALGFKPVCDFHDGIAAMVERYRNERS